MISIESELAPREANLESLQQQQAALTGQVALSTISLSLTAVTDSGTSVQPVTPRQRLHGRSERRAGPRCSVS